MSFQINVENLCWINDAADDPEDLCLHGKATAVIGDELLQYDATVSASALYLLRSLTEDHLPEDENQMLPCCGFSMYADDTLENVDIIGCPNGIDWTVSHSGDDIVLITSSGTRVTVPLEDYQKEVVRFADKIERFYLACTPKNLPEDPVDRNGYLAFWNEWHRRRSPFFSN